MWQVSSYQFPAANLSLFHEALHLADVIIDETYPHGQPLTTVRQLASPREIAHAPSRRHAKFAKAALRAAVQVPLGCGAAPSE